jgi:ferric-dicitrate binding protein FerR (iron transport regulator)
VSAYSRGPGDDSDQDGTLHLLRVTEPRPLVPAARAGRVRSAVHAEWVRARRRRALRRGVIGAAATLAVAAAVLVLVGPLSVMRREPPRSAEPVAVIERLEGPAPPAADVKQGRAAPPLQQGTPVHAGEWIETGSASRAALRFADGSSVRLDVASRARPLSAGAIELAAGAVYVDSGRETGGFEVRTALATARDIGTQFEVRLIGQDLRLRVRTGVVELTDRRRSLSARAGTEITISTGTATTRPFAAHGTDWEWTSRLAPPPPMDGTPLAVFLERVAREQGWMVSYADPPLADDAARIVLHGSAAGLTALQSVQLATGASGLRCRLDGGKLIVLRAREEAAHTEGSR